MKQKNAMRHFTNFFHTFFVAIFILVLTGSRVAPAQPVRILFLSNLNGVLENCRCGDPALGGLDRIAQIIDDKRRDSMRTIVADAGDFMNPYPYPEVNAAVLKAYSLIRPDVLSLGEQEFIAGKNTVTQLTRWFPAALIAGNYRVSALSLKRFQSFSGGGRNHIIFLSWLDKTAFAYSQISYTPIYDAQNYKKYYELYKNSAFLITLYHGEESELQTFADRYPGNKLILTGHTQASTINATDPPFIVAGRADGEYLLEIIIDMDANPAAIEVNPIAVSLDVPPNQEVKKIIDEYKTASHQN